MRYGVMGNGILEEAEGMEAFWNQDWKGSVIICPGGGYQWLSPREGEPVAKAFAALGWKPWILYYSVAGPGEVLGTEPVKQAAEAVKIGPDVGTGKICISVRFFSRGPCGCQFGSAVE